MRLEAPREQRHDVVDVVEPDARHRGTVLRARCAPDSAGTE